MEYVIKKTNKFGESFLGHSYLDWKYDRGVFKKARRWKTKKGAEKALDEIISKELSWGNYKTPEEQLREQIVIKKVKPLPPPKFKKQKLTHEQLNEKRLEIAKLLIKNGWKPNQYVSYINLDENGFDHSFDGSFDGNYGDGYLIDPDKRFAVTLKGSVMTVHDGTRAFCKVISMAYNEITLQKQQLICGRIILSLG